jgi:hypothetical protein
MYIHDVVQTRLEAAIHHFLNSACRVTPQWFNKPKFHVLLHLPNHIRRFGPAMLFATEGFESFNAIIRAASIHSNRRSNRVRHLVCGGFFPNPAYTETVGRQAESFRHPGSKPTSPWFQRALSDRPMHWSQATVKARNHVFGSKTGRQMFGLSKLADESHPERCKSTSNTGLSSILSAENS